jgi:hypothetical protein
MTYIMINGFAMIRNTSIVKQPSTFALLVDDISKMTLSEQKLLWIKLNKEKLGSLAKKMDAKASPGNLSDKQVATLVKRQEEDKSIALLRRTFLPGNKPAY